MQQLFSDANNHVCVVEVEKEKRMFFDALGRRRLWKCFAWSQIERAFHHAFFILDRRNSLFICLPLGSLDKLAIKREIDRIGGE